MKAKTQFQKKVVAISKRLPSISNDQLYRLINNIEFPVFTDKKGYTCSCCGHKFNEEQTYCPHCGRKLHFDYYYKNKRTVKGEYFYQALVLQRKDVTITRHFLFRCNFYKGNGYTVKWGEVQQTFYSLNGEYEVMAVKRDCLGKYYYESQWCLDTDLRLMSHKMDNAYRYPLMYSVYHSKKYIPQLYHITDDTIQETSQYNKCTRKAIRVCPQLETIYKQHPELFRYFVTDTHSLLTYWKSLKIAFRNKMRIDDIVSYINYLSYLKRLGKDLCNPKFVAPVNFSESYARVRSQYGEWLKRHNPAYARAERMRQELLVTTAERQKQFDEEVATYEKLYAIEHQGLLDIVIHTKNLTITALQSVQEFKEEGEAMHHCVYRNKYWKKPDTLILSAKLGDKRIETIEVNTRTHEIIQSRGACNQPTAYHDEIINAIMRHYAA